MIVEGQRSNRRRETGWVVGQGHCSICFFFFFFQAEDGIRDRLVTGVQTCALPILQIEFKMFG